MDRLLASIDALDGNVNALKGPLEPIGRIADRPDRRPASGQPPVRRLVPPAADGDSAATAVEVIAAELRHALCEGGRGE
jgi:hypothetical protein